MSVSVADPLRPWIMSKRVGAIAKVKLGTLTVRLRVMVLAMLPLTARMVKARGPPAAAVFDVRMASTPELPVIVILDALTPVGGFNKLTTILPRKLFCRVTITAVFPVVPRIRLRDVGFMPNVNVGAGVGAGAVTVRLIVAVFVIPLPVVWTVSVFKPVVADAPTEMARVAFAPEITVVGMEMPAGGFRRLAVIALVIPF